MKRAPSNEVKRGQTISFRVPSDTPDHILKHLQTLKDTERRNFASKIAEFVMQGVGNAYSREKESITIPLPRPLSKVQRDWLKHEHSEILLGSIVYQLLADPVRATSLLVALKSNAVDIDEALYTENDLSQKAAVQKQEEPKVDLNSIDLEDDLMNFDWESASAKRFSNEKIAKDHKEENDVEALLGGFLAQMNK